MGANGQRTMGIFSCCAKIFVTGCRENLFSALEGRPKWEAIISFLGLNSSIFLMVGKSPVEFLNHR